MWFLAAVLMFVPASLAIIIAGIFIPFVLPPLYSLLTSIGLTPRPEYLPHYVSIIAISPVAEETFRSLSARWTGLLNSSIPTVLAVGASIGVLEFLWKAYSYGAFSGDSIIISLEWLISIPGQMALTLFSYSLLRYRVPLMVVLHGSLNSFNLLIASQLDAALTGTRYTAALMAVNLATCAIVAVGAILNRRSAYVLR